MATLREFIIAAETEHCFWTAVNAWRCHMPEMRWLYNYQTKSGMDTDIPLLDVGYHFPIEYMMFVYEPRPVVGFRTGDPEIRDESNIFERMRESFDGYRWYSLETPSKKQLEWAARNFIIQTFGYIDYLVEEKKRKNELRGDPLYPQGFRIA
jgi:hypothetical protein